MQNNTEEVEESIQETQDDGYKDFSTKQVFELEIDELRQEVELPTREDNPLENSSKDQNNIPQIRIISPQEAKQRSFDSAEFQLESMASLETIKRFEQIHLFPDETPKEETIRLIKKEELLSKEVAQNPQEFIESSQVVGNQGNQDSTNSTSVTHKPKPIKAYPKRLYSAIPFSAHYDKEPVGTHDCLVQDNPKNADYLQDLPRVQEMRNDEPSTIFYYGKVKTSKPIQAQTIQQDSKIAIHSNENDNQETEENLSENSDTVPLQTEPETLNHIIRQVIQEFMESKSPQATPSSNDTWEEATDAVKENSESQNLSSKKESITQEANLEFIQSSKPTESLNYMEKPQMFNEGKQEKSKMQGIQVALNYAPSFAANKIPSYGYRFENDLENKTKIVESQNCETNLSQNSEVINLFRDSKENIPRGGRKTKKSKIRNLFLRCPTRNLACLLLSKKLRKHRIGKRILTY